MGVPSKPAPLSGGADRLAGRIFNNRFRIHSLLARGGMGKVYRAVQVPLGRVVALKVLHPSLIGKANDDFHRRFFLEASIAAQLSHPHTVTVYDFGQSDDGIYYLAMEFLQGICLRQALRQAAPFAPRRALHIALQIASALREAHGLGAIHRDLKPANIYLLDGGGRVDFVKVLDFGLVKSVAANDEDSRITQPGKFLGSPGYMAPEQIRGKPLDCRCDIYALGVLLYEMLSGRPPFVRSSPLETMRAHVHDPVAPMAVT
ncbi:MAG: serine/threonine protein kinase, partial [Deltaproteobacteria bacterium]